MAMMICLYGVVVASPAAKFAANFVKLGFHPGFGLTHTLPRVVGRHNAARMFLTGTRYEAEAAMWMGLVDQMVAPEHLLKAAQDMAAGLAGNAPLAMRSTRKTLRADLAAAVRAANAWACKSHPRTTAHATHDCYVNAAHSDPSHCCTETRGQNPHPTAAPGKRTR